jgi:hypothetical protein
MVKAFHVIRRSTAAHLLAGSGGVMLGTGNSPRTVDLDD